jgi:membrane-bound lytic murein transglycosylase B
MEEAGVVVPETVPATLRYGLIDLEDDTRPVQYWLATNNFFAITRYNRSYYYAMAVIDLGQAIARQRSAR